MAPGRIPTRSAGLDDHGSPRGKEEPRAVPDDLPILAARLRAMHRELERRHREAEALHDEHQRLDEQHRRLEDGPVGPWTEDVAPTEDADQR